MTWNWIHVLNYFTDYLKHGYYPFYKEDPEGFNDRLAEVCRQVIDQDIPAVTEVEYATVQKLKKLSSPDKLFLDNPNLMYALSGNPEIGTIRESFFYNQLSRVCNVYYPGKGDFLVDGKYLFEVGGPGKSFEQIKDIENSFLAIDGVEFGRGNKIPLWIFGFLYWCPHPVVVDSFPFYQGGQGEQSH